jgi:hypothetical protein
MKVWATLFLASVMRQVALAQGVTIEVTPAATARAGATVTVKWSGPNGPGDFITVARKGAAPSDYLDYRLTSDGRTSANPASIVMPASPGSYEIRYVRGNPRSVLATVPYEVTAIAASIEGPPSVTPGSRFDVAWSGPNDRGDWVTIVEAGAAPRAYGSYVDARAGRADGKTGLSVATLLAPTKPGRYELRYVQQGSIVIGTRAIDVTTATSASSSTTSPLAVSPVVPVLTIPVAQTPSSDQQAAGDPSAPPLMAPSTSLAGLKPTTGAAVLSSTQCSAGVAPPFTFAASPTMTGYRVSRRDLGELTPTPVSASSYTHTAALFASTTYQYVISGLQSDGGCTTATVSVTPPRPLTPQVTATITTTGVRLSWRAQSDHPTDYLVLGPGLPATGTEVPASMSPADLAINNLAAGTHTWLVTPLWKTPTGTMSDVAFGGRVSATIGAIPPRTIALVGFTGAGTAVIIAPRAISVSGFTGVGTAVVIPPRTITLDGWTGIGSSTTVQGVIIR